MTLSLGLHGRNEIGERVRLACWGLRKLSRVAKFPPFHPSSFLLLTLLRRFQLGAHRRQTHLGRHETRIRVRDGHTQPSFF